MQAYLNGVENPAFKNFFTVKTFVAKVIGSALAVGSSLIMGKEGPMLHAGSILAVILGECNCHGGDCLLHWLVCPFGRGLYSTMAETASNTETPTLSSMAQAGSVAASVG